METETCANDYTSSIFFKKEMNSIYPKETETKKNSSDETEKSSADLAKIKEEFNNSKKLILEIMSSNSKENFSTIEINPYGYVDSLRPKDGCTFFGYFPKNSENNFENYVDYTLKNKDNSYDESYIGKYFRIKFNPYDLNYYLKDTGHGFGTFMKIMDWTEIKNNFLLNIGENYIVLFLGDEDDDEDESNININVNNNLENNENEKLNIENKNKNNNNSNNNTLNIKIFSGNIDKKIYKFLPENSPITIGRSSENNIFIDDDLLSRTHCTIDFYENKWYIQDGFAKNGYKEECIKKSTNGSWIYAYEDIPIFDKMIFKANHYLFICNLI